MFWVAYEIAIILCGIYISWRWFIERVSFPIMERSPWLSIYFLVNVMVYLLLYPLFLQSSFLSSNCNALWLKSILIPTGGSYTYIYLVKSFRLYWGFTVQRGAFEKRFQGSFNAVLKREYVLVIVCIIFASLHVLTGIIPTEGVNHQFDFV